MKLLWSEFPTNNPKRQFTSTPLLFHRKKCKKKRDKDKYWGNECHEFAFKSKNDEFKV